MKWNPRVASKADIPQLNDLIPRSSFALQQDVYSREKTEAALGPVFGVDVQLIEDGTYFVVEDKGKIVGCGGWSFRKSLFGGNDERTEPDPRLDPKVDSARVRAFFIDPDYARQGIGSAIMKECEDALIAMGFAHVEISATLVGEPLYAKFGYKSVEHYEIPLEGAKPMDVVKMTKTIKQNQNQVVHSIPSSHSSPTLRE
ncbi:MAG: GNAT family N-acetyltransferase [Verrucomicrobia bacterium]|nr:GNAT family N-acetyltransferase [Verrucomicrobiota bacterium]